MIRWKLSLAVVTICALVGAFFVLRFDSWLAKQIESSISSVTGTKTDVRNLKTKFFPPRISIGGLEIASQRDAMKNLLEFERIELAFELSPLFEKRFVLNEFSIVGVDWGTERTRSGFLPKKPKKESWLDPYMDEAFDRLGAEFESLPLTRLADFRIPDDPNEVLNLLDLQSEQAFREAAARFEEAQSRWKAQISELRSLKDYERFLEDAKRATRDIPKDPKAIAERIRIIKSSIEFFEREKEKATSLVKAADDQWKDLQDTFSSARSALESDFDRAKSTLSLEQLNVDNLSRLLFGAHWVERAEEFLALQSSFRKAYAKLKPPDQPELEVRQRQRGREVQFVVPTAKPKFIWEKSDFSIRGLEREEADRLSQTYQVQVRDVTSSPRLYGKPTEIDLKARFRETFLTAAHLNLFFDYTDLETQLDRYEAEMEGLEATIIPVGVPRIFPMRFSDGEVDVQSRFERKPETLKWTNRMNFSGVQWDLREVPQIGFLIPPMSRVLEGIRQFYVELEFSKDENGPFRFQVRSDLDGQLKKAVFAEIERQLQAFYVKLRAKLNEKVAHVRDHAESELKAYRSDIMEELDKKAKVADQYRKQAESELKSFENRAKAAAENEVKKAAPKALEQLKKALPKSPF